MSLRSAMANNIGAMLDGAMHADEAIRVLGRIEEEGIKPEQIAGAVDAVMARMVPFPEFPEAIDCCGTGGDYQHTYNISSATAIVVAACGVQVAKHGNRAITSKSGSADVLEALGVCTTLSAEKCARVLDEAGICFLFAPVFHPGLARVAPLRKAVGHRTIFNLLGPLCNPARVNAQLIGVYDGRLCHTVAEAAHMLGRSRVMAVHGADGADELSITGESAVSHLHDGSVSDYTLHPRRAGLATARGEAIRGGTAGDNASAMLEIFDGVENAYARAVTFNAAAALCLAGKAPALRGGAHMAHAALTGGAAKRKLHQLIEASQRA